MAKRVAKRSFARFANRVLRVAHEKKYIELSTTFGTPATSSGAATGAPFTVALTNIAIGDTENSRDGNQVYLRSLDIRLRAIVNPEYSAFGTAAPTNPWSTAGAWFNDKVRLIIWQWFPMDDPTTGAPSLQDTILQAATTLSPYNHDNRKNFRILYDKKVRLAQNVVDVDGTGSPFSYGYPMHELADFSVRIRRFANRVLTFQGSSASANNHVYLTLMTDWAANTNTTETIPPVLIYHHLKTNYSDK